MREERRQRRVRSDPAKLEVFEADRSGKLVFELDQVCLQRGDRKILEQLSLRIQRGDRIGLVGPNGFGKSSLLKLLLGELEPDSGLVSRAATLKIAYYDQQREQLDLSASVFDNVNDGNEYVGDGEDRRHISSWLRDFLFRPEQFRTPASALSGGERNRLLLARIFARPANLLVLDEPTNDLDIETLELLEEKISDFKGTLLLVSHDRTFLDRVVSSLLILEGEGKVQEFVGGWTDWRTWQSQRNKESKTVKKIPGNELGKETSETRRRPARLSYKEQREFDALPQKLEALEARKATLESEIMRPEFYAQADQSIRDALKTLQQLEAEIALAWDRWAELEALSVATAG
jgi:ATP-binding cassette subfamily F protein uup